MSAADFNQIMEAGNPAASLHFVRGCVVIDKNYIRMSGFTTEPSGHEPKNSRISSGGLRRDHSASKSSYGRPRASRSATCRSRSERVASASTRPVRSSNITP